MKITLQGRYKNGVLLDVLRDRGWNSANSLLPSTAALLSSVSRCS